MKTAAFSAAELRFGAEYPGPRICRTFAQNCAAVSSQGLPEIAGPLGGRPKAGRAAGSFARRSGKADHAARTSSRRSGKVDHAARTSPRRSAKADNAARTSSRRSAKADRAARTSSRRSGKADRAARTSSRRSGKADHAARTSSRRSAKADNGGPLCPGGRFSGRAAGRNGALPYNARKSQFLRNGDVWATESLFLFAVLWLAFLPDQSETGVAGGGKARRPETPAAPRRPRPTTATGSRFLRRQRERPPRRPRPSPPAREGSLGAPNDRTFPPGAERKARKEKGKEEPRMERAPPL